MYAGPRYAGHVLVRLAASLAFNRGQRACRPSQARLVLRQLNTEPCTGARPSERAALIGHWLKGGGGS
jgi:hypothetical protein